MWAFFFCLHPWLSARDTQDVTTCLMLPQHVKSRFDLHLFAFFIFLIFFCCRDIFFKVGKHCSMQRRCFFSLFLQHSDTGSGSCTQSENVLIVVWVLCKKPMGDVVYNGRHREVFQAMHHHLDFAGKIKEPSLARFLVKHKHQPYKNSGKAIQ